MKRTMTACGVTTLVAALGMCGVAQADVSTLIKEAAHGKSAVKLLTESPKDQLKDRLKSKASDMVNQAKGKAYQNAEENSGPTGKRVGGARRRLEAQKSTYDAAKSLKN